LINDDKVSEMRNSSNALLILGNQLFPKLAVENVPIFMAEDHGLCTHYRYHKHKILFFLLSMRRYHSSLMQARQTVHYEPLTDHSSLNSKLIRFIEENHIKTLHCYEIEDKFFETGLRQSLQKQGVELIIHPSPMFLTSRPEFASYLKDVKRPFMKTFYEKQRKRLKILVDKDLKPIGGQWSFDEDNRKPLPASITPPKIPTSLTPKDKGFDELVSIVEKFFSDHPGDLKDFWLPTDRKGALKLLSDFLKNRFEQFGPYEDALPPHSDFVFHSALSASINIGHLTPDEVVQEALKYAEKNKVNIASTEGFVRQIIGWREFIRGIYQNFSDTQESMNFWNHKRRITKHWYDGTTGIPILDRTISKVNRLGFCHHIERLMVLSNLMLLCEIDPQEVHRWFMEMFVDSSDWVMGPNVYGMGQFSDGGIFATKPYICGSNYLIKMSKEPKGPWCDIVDGLYWSFIEKHEGFYKKNPRMSVMVKALSNLSAERKKTIYKAAKEFRERVTC
jgi:deoxyribodipyrimidine photolyase-related protein